MLDGKKTHALSWVILILAALAGGTDALLRSLGETGISIPARWLAVLGALLAAAQAGLRNLTAGPAASPRTWGAPSWLGVLFAMLLAALATRVPAEPDSAHPVPGQGTEVEVPMKAPELPLPGAETAVPDPDTSGALDGFPGAILGILNLGCSAAQVRAWTDGAEQVATCLAGCGVSTLSYRIVPGSHEVRLDGLSEDLLHCVLPCLLRVGVAAISVKLATDGPSSQPGRTP